MHLRLSWEQLRYDKRLYLQRGPYEIALVSPSKQHSSVEVCSATQSEESSLYTEEDRAITSKTCHVTNNTSLLYQSLDISCLQVTFGYILRDVLS